MALWGNKDTKTITGTVDVTQNSGTVSGTSTTFTTQLKTGQTLVIGGVEYRVTKIASNTSLTIAPVYAGSTDTGLTVTANEQPAFIPLSEMDDVYFVDRAEVSAGGDNVVSVAIVSGGSGYVEAPGVSFSGGGGSSAAASATISGGAVTAVTMSNVGSSYETVPTVTIQVPVLTVGTAAVNTTTESIAYTAHGQAVAAALTYQDGGGTAATGLTDNTTYYVSEIGRTANAFRLAASSGAATAATIAGGAVSGTAGQFTCTETSLAANDRVVITGTLTGTATITGYTTGTIYKVSAVTGTSPNVTGFTLTAEDGTAVVSTAGTITGLTLKSGTLVNISGTGNNAQYFEIVAGTRATATAAKGTGETGTQVTHSGWVKRTVGTGGRAGRVQYETLVAMGTPAATSGDASDDLQFPDA